MDITPAIADGKQLIEAYAEGYFRISGQVHAHPVLVCDEQAFNWPVRDVEKLIADDFDLLQEFDPRPTLILLGTGATQIFPPKELKDALRVRGYTVEAMASDAACRTYSVLLAEGRAVAAALFPL